MPGPRCRDQEALPESGSMSPRWVVSVSVMAPFTPLCGKRVGKQPARGADPRSPLTSRSSVPSDHFRKSHQGSPQRNPEASVYSSPLPERALRG